VETLAWKSAVYVKLFVDILMLLSFKVSILRNYLALVIINNLDIINNIHSKSCLHINMYLMYLIIILHNRV